jgi:hypothetical protein
VSIASPNCRNYPDLVELEAVQAAEKLRRTLWGNKLNVILEEISVAGSTWQYVPKKWIDFLEMWKLGCRERNGLLVRPEYDAALKMETFDYEKAKNQNCGGVIVTGQPGIGALSLLFIENRFLNANTGKSCFLYYVLFRRLCEKKPVALELSDHYLVFQDDGVYIHPLAADPYNRLPDETWALSDSGAKDNQPCNAFLNAAEWQVAWVIQTTSPRDSAWKAWKRHYFAKTFVMDYFSINEITALGSV